MRFRNVSKLGDLDVPPLRAVIAAGEEFDVPPELGAGFAAQPANFEPVDAEAQALAQADDDAPPTAAPSVPADPPPAPGDDDNAPDGKVHD